MDEQLQRLLGNPPQNPSSALEGLLARNAWYERFAKSFPNNAALLAQESDRLKRAEQQGFNLQAYHGTPNAFTTFKTTRGDLGIHFGDAATASAKVGFLTNKHQTHGRIIPALLSLHNPLRMRDIGFFEDPLVANELMRLAKKGGVNFTPKEVLDTHQAAQAIRRQKGPPWLGSFIERSFQRNADRMEVWRKFLESKGYDGAVYRNVAEGPGTDSYLVFRPHQIRSRFDPFAP